MDLGLELVHPGPRSVTGSCAVGGEIHCAAWWASHSQVRSDVEDSPLHGYCTNSGGGIVLTASYGCALCAASAPFPDMVRYRAFPSENVSKLHQSVRLGQPGASYSLWYNIHALALCIRLLFWSVVYLLFLYSVLLLSLFVLLTHPPPLPRDMTAFTFLSLFFLCSTSPVGCLRAVCFSLMCSIQYDILEVLHLCIYI